jgi:hypothetical protein
MSLFNIFIYTILLFLVSHWSRHKFSKTHTYILFYSRALLNTWILRCHIDFWTLFEHTLVSLVIVKTCLVNKSMLIDLCLWWITWKVFFKTKTLNWKTKTFTWNVFFKTAVNILCWGTLWQLMDLSTWNNLIRWFDIFYMFMIFSSHVVNDLYDLIVGCSAEEQLEVSVWLLTVGFNVCDSWLIFIWSC